MVATTTSVSTNANLYQRTVECASCLRKSTLTPPFISFSVPIQAKPLYCPTCSKPRVVRPYDYADILCTDNAGLSRAQAIRIITLFNEQRDRGSLKHASLCIDPLDYINDMGAKDMPALKDVVTPLSVSCTDCAGSYTLLRNIPDIQRTAPLYCVWCASSNVHINQLDTDETAWICLSQHYSVPVQVIKMLYDRWNTHSRATKFDDYMHSDLIQQLLTA